MKGTGKRQENTPQQGVVTGSTSNSKLIGQVKSLGGSGRVEGVEAMMGRNCPRCKRRVYWTTDCPTRKHNKSSIRKRRERENERGGRERKRNQKTKIWSFKRNFDERLNGEPGDNYVTNILLSLFIN